MRAIARVLRQKLRPLRDRIAEQAGQRLETHTQKFSKKQLNCTNRHSQTTAGSHEIDPKCKIATVKRGKDSHLTIAAISWQ
jgi:hypothetical protein